MTSRINARISDDAAKIPARLGKHGYGSVAHGTGRDDLARTAETCPVLASRVGHHSLMRFVASAHRGHSRISLSKRGDSNNQ